ncbi:MAG: DUF2339 domain-containing protein [Allorhizobium sp.]
MFELLPLILIGVLFVINRGAAKRIDRLERELGEVRERLLRVSGATAAPSAIPMETEELADVAQPKTVAETVTAEEPPLDGAPYQSAPASLPEENTELLATAARSKATPAAPAESLENLLGARWAVWAGGLALALGGVFLVRYSIESGLLGPGVRLTLAALFGLLLIAAGELVIPFDLAVPAPDAFYVAARNDVRAAPIAKVFIDWIFDMIETERTAQPRPASRTSGRSLPSARKRNANTTAVLSEES